MSHPPSFPPPLPQDGPPSPSPWSPPSTPAPAAPPSGYAAYPAGPPPGGPPSGPLVVPRSVTQAFVLMLTHCVLGVVALIVTLATRDQLVARVERQQRLQAQRAGVPNPVDPTAIVNAGIVIGVVVGVAVLVFYGVLAFQVRRGRQWARIVTWVFAGLGVLGLATQFLVPASAPARVIGTATGLIDLAIIVLLALRPTSAFVAAVTARRRA